MKRNLAAVALPALLAAAPAPAHFQEWALPSFLSRCADTKEAAIAGFTTFKPEETVIVIR